MTNETERRMEYQGSWAAASCPARRPAFGRLAAVAAGGTYPKAKPAGALLGLQQGAKGGRYVPAQGVREANKGQNGAGTCLPRV